MKVGKFICHEDFYRILSFCEITKGNDFKDNKVSSLFEPIVQVGNKRHDILIDLRGGINFLKTMKF